MLPLTLVTLLIATQFLCLPFIAPGRFFSMQVAPEWLISVQARRIRHTYQTCITLVTLICVAAHRLALMHPKLAVLIPVLEVAGILTAYSWGWRRTLQHQVKQPVVRSASLARDDGASAILWCQAALVPVFAAAIILLARYGSIPATFANHFNLKGEPNHIVGRTELSVFGPLLLGAAIVLLLAGLLRMIQRYGAGTADRGNYTRLTQRIMVGITWMVALECASFSLLPLAHRANAYAARLSILSGIVAVVLLLVTIGVLFRNHPALVSGQRATAAEHWKAGLVYYNREDAALFVPKRLGFGWTLNMAQPAAWLLMGLVLVLALAPLVLKRL